MLFNLQCNSNQWLAPALSMLIPIIIIPLIRFWSYSKALPPPNLQSKFTFLRLIESFTFSLSVVGLHVFFVCSWTLRFLCLQLDFAFSLSAAGLHFFFVCSWTSLFLCLQLDFTFSLSIMKIHFFYAQIGLKRNLARPNSFAQNKLFHSSASNCS
jgi:hypothetical protein